MSWTEVVAFVTGAICVVLTVRRNVWNFPIGIANNAVFIVLFVGSGLYADAALQVVYVGLAVAGWGGWLTGRRLEGDVVVRRAGPRLVAGAVFAVALMTGALAWLLAAQTDSVVPFWDALTTALSLVAQYLLNKRYLENWLLWITADVLYIGLYAFKGLWLTTALYVLFLALCVVGIRSWRRSMTASAVLTASQRPFAEGLPA